MRKTLTLLILVSATIAMFFWSLFVLTEPKAVSKPMQRPVPVDPRFN